MADVVLIELAMAKCLPPVDRRYFTSVQTEN